MTTTSEPSAAIEALGLGKAFGAVKAVDGLDLSVPSGGVFVSPATLPGWVLLASAALTAVFGPLTMRLYRAGQSGS